MPVILERNQAPDLKSLLGSIKEACALVVAVEDGQKYSASARIQGIGSLVSASPSEISFIVSAKHSDSLATTAACAVLMTPEIAERLDAPVDYAKVICHQPYLLYALIARWFDQKRRPMPEASVHPSATVDPTANISSSAYVGPNVVIGARTIIGENVQVHANTTIGSDCLVGDESLLYANVTLYDHVSMGQRCILHSGAVLGADGFGFAPNPAAGPGAWGKIAQLGGVVLGHDVEIGANTTIDRGALDDTVIGNGVKLDNQIMIAHNCQIGDHTAMAAWVGIAGSTKVGARCTIAGAAMLSGHLEIADDVHISGGTAITADIDKPGRYTGVLPFAPHAHWQRNAAVIGQLAQLRKRLRQLERN